MDLLIVRFRVDSDLRLVFQALESKEGLFESLRLVKVRGSNVDTNLKPELLDVLFAPKIVRISETRWTMEIRPLTEKIIIEKRKSGKYLCFYQFDALFCQIRDILVDGSVITQKLWFTINATYQASKDAPKQVLEKRIDCSDDFVTQLSNLFK